MGGTEACGDRSPGASRVAFGAGGADVFSGVTAWTEGPATAGAGASVTAGVVWAEAAGDPASPDAGCPEPGLDEHPAKRRAAARTAPGTTAESHFERPILVADSDLSMRAG